MDQKIRNTQRVFKQVALLRDAILTVGIGKKKSQHLTLQQCERLCACWAELQETDILYRQETVFAPYSDRGGGLAFGSLASPLVLDDLFGDARAVIAILEKTPVETLCLANQHLLASYGAFFAALFHKGFTPAERRLPDLFLKLLATPSEVVAVEKQATGNAATFAFESDDNSRILDRRDAVKKEFPASEIEAFLTKVWQWGSKGENASKSAGEKCGSKGQKRNAENSQHNSPLPGEDLLAKSSVPFMAIAIAAKKTTLSFAQAQQLGHFLFSEDRIAEKNKFSRARDDFFCGFFASYLRVRYESQEEWRGLLSSLQPHVAKLPLHGRLASNAKLSTATHSVATQDFTERKMPATAGETAIENKQKQAAKSKDLLFLFAEPANGFSKTFFLSPLYGAWLEANGFRACHLVGENPGPKMVMNLFDLFSFMRLPSIKKNNDAGTQTAFGSIADYKDFCLPIAQWRSRRLAIAKRPFFSTLEKFVSPFAKKKTVLVTSAFHPPYWEKMIKLGQFAGYKGVLVLKSSREGGLTPSLVRPLRASFSLCTDAASLDEAKTIDGVGQRLEYCEEKLEIPVAGKSMVSDEKVGLTCQANATLLNRALASPNFRLADEKYQQRFAMFVALLEKCCKRIADSGKTKD